MKKYQNSLSCEEEQSFDPYQALMAMTLILCSTCTLNGMDMS